MKSSISVDALGAWLPKLDRDAGEAGQASCRGLEALSKGDNPRAIEWLNRAVEAEPRDGVHRINLGCAYLAAGQSMEAAWCFREALELMPESAEARYNLGLTCIELGSYEDAVYCLRDALRFRPHHPPTVFALAHALGSLGRRTEAAACYRETLRLEPEHCGALNALGMAALSAGDRRAATEWVERACAQHPGEALSYLNRGLVSLAGDDPGDAEAWFRQALQRKENYPEAWCNLASAQLQLGCATKARISATRALDSRPTHVPSRVNLGFARQMQGDLEGAIAEYRQVLGVAPQDPAVHWNLALALLAAGEWEEGFREYEWRFEAGITPRRPGRVWDGAPCRRILVWAEQGLGDTIQFARYLPMVAAHCAEVYFEAQPRVRQLLESSPLLKGIRWHRGEPVDAHVPLLSLPGLFRTRPDELPSPGPYLDSGRGSGSATLRAGLCWSGNPGHRQNRVRSLDSPSVARLAAAPGIEWVSLQRGAGARDLPVGLRLEEPVGGTLLDAAEVIGSLDLVVTVDTMVAHLAGAMGKPVWLLLARMADWRWLNEGECSGWYRSMRLFRQSEAGRWQDAVDRVLERLEQWTPHTG